MSDAQTGRAYSIISALSARSKAAEKNAAAVRTFTWAMEAEKTHARLYAEVIALVGAGMKDSWAATARDFYVCAVCGYTSETEEEHERCPVCNLSWDKFEVIR